MPTRSRSLLFLPILVVLSAGVVIWLGARLARQERIERVATDENVTARYAAALTEAIRSLESRYETHLEGLSREDFTDTFVFAEAAESIVGVRQVSSLAANGESRIVFVPKHLLDRQAKFPVPVYSEKNLPLRRERAFLVAPPAFPEGLPVGSTGWVGADDELFFFRQLSGRRTSYLLVDPEAVSAAIQVGLGDLSKSAPEIPSGGGLVLLSSNRPLLSRGEWEGKSPDLVHRIGSRFGDWEIRSRDPRVLVVDYEPLPLLVSALIASVLVAGGILVFVVLRRALRLAEQRVSFVNQVSHELKSPLTNILLNTDLAFDGADPAGQRRLSLIREESERLSRLIDNVLAFSRRPTSRSAAPAALCLFEAASRTVEMFRPALERRGIAIRIEGEPVSALADPDVFSQILGNLLSNVEKYAASGAVARIQVFPDQDKAVARVADAGPGIPERDRERVFFPFLRLDHRTAEGASGTGLGLSIARDLAEGLGGSLRLLPLGPEPGCVFELTLPRAEAPEKILPFPPSMAS